MKPGISGLFLFLAGAFQGCMYINIFFAFFIDLVRSVLAFISSMNSSPKVLLPDPNNPYETALAHALDAVCSGQVIFMVGGAHLQEAEDQLKAGSLNHMRREYVDFISTVAIPILESNPVQLGPNLCLARERLQAPGDLARLLRQCLFTMLKRGST